MPAEDIALLASYVVVFLAGYAVRALISRRRRRRHDLR